MKNFLMIFILGISISVNAADYKVFFKSEATDKRINIVEPDVIFLNLEDKIVFNSKNVELNKIKVLKINNTGIISEASTDVYRTLVDQSYLKTDENCLYFYYSSQYLSSGAFGLSIVGSFYQKQAQALKTINYNQNFTDRIDHILNSLTPVDQTPISSEPTTP